MGTIQIQNACLAFGERDIIKNVGFTLDEKSRAALAGANGSGKSTLLKMISGHLTADSITISKTKGLRVSYLPQADIVFPDISVYAAVEKAFARFDELLAEQHQIGNELAKITSDDKYSHLLERSSQIDEILISSGYNNRKTLIGQILAGLGFKESDYGAKCSIFSGGWQMRIALAKILAEDPDILLLDEPTNYLDIEATCFLKDYLKSFPGGVMLVSHDQGFLDDTINCVYELFQGKLTRYSGNYTTYLKTREEEIEALQKAFERQSEEIAKTEEFIERFRYKATKSKQVQSRIKSLEKVEMIEIPDHLKKLSFSFPPAPHSGNDVLITEHLGKAFGNHTIFTDLSFIVKKGERLAITGRNGAGKSTLLRILAGVDTSFSGTLRLGAGVKMGYFAQDNETGLTPENTVLEEIEEVADTKDTPKVRSLLGSFLFVNDDVFKKTQILSGGEKSRLSLLKILLHPANLLLLDEPTNHLDINAKEMLLEAIKAYEGTTIFVSHDTHFIKNLATRILYLSDDGPEFFEGDYDYFAYKLEEKESRFAERSGSKNGKEETRNDTGARSHQDDKARRNRLRALQKACDELLAESERLNEEIAAVTKETEDPEVYSNAIKIRDCMKKKERLEKLSEEVETRWLEKCEDLEKEEAEC